MDGFIAATRASRPGSTTSRLSQSITMPSAARAIDVSQSITMPSAARAIDVSQSITMPSAARAIDVSQSITRPSAARAIDVSQSITRPVVTRASHPSITTGSIQIQPSQPKVKAQTGMSVFDPNKHCALCMRLFKEPKILPCLHIFCKMCLSDHLSSTSSTQAFCPTCKSVFADGKPRGSIGDVKPREEVVKSLHTDFVSKALAESARVLIKPPACRGCHMHIAGYFCLSCDDFLCTSCVGVHGNLSIGALHEVKSLATLTPHELATKRPASCNAHAGCAAQHFCRKHDAFLCQSCVIFDHHACPEVTLAFKRVAELPTELKEKAEKLKTEEAKLDKVAGNLDEIMRELDDQGQKNLSDIDEKCDRLERAVQATRLRLKEKAQNDVIQAKTQVLVAKQRCGDVSRSFATQRLAMERIKPPIPTAVLNDIMTALTSDVADTYDRVGFSLDTEFKVAALPAVDPMAVQRVERAVSGLDLGQPDPPDAASFAIAATREWRFHTNHGSEVAISTNGQTAIRRVPGNEKGMVVAAQAMKPNELYEVEVEEIGEDIAWWFTCGVLCVKSVDQFPLPDTTYKGCTDAFVFNKNVHDSSRKLVPNNAVKSALFRMKAGERVGVMVDSLQRLHLWVNDKDITTVQGVLLPCFAFFELDLRFKQVKTLPLKFYQK